MTPNERFAKLAGICWHELTKALEKPKIDKHGTHLCIRCGEAIHKWHWEEGHPKCFRVPDAYHNPDFTDAREVWKVVGKNKDFHKYLYEKGWAIIEERGAVNLIFLDSRCWIVPELLRDIAIEWMEGKGERERR